MDKIQNALESILETRISNVSIKKITGNGIRTNEIFMISSDERKFVLKLLATKDTVQGEESILDIVYDSKIHEFVAKKSNKFMPVRKIIAYDTTENNPFNRKFAIQHYIEGTIPVNFTSPHLDDVKLLFNDIIEMYSRSPRKSNSGIIKESELEESGIPVDETLKNYIHFLQERLSKSISGNFLIHCIYRDIESAAPKQIKDTVLESMHRMEERMSYPINYLVHGDLKTANILRNQFGYVLIDWSRAYYGDLAHDIAFFLVSVANNSPVSYVLNCYDEIVNLLKSNKIQFGNDVETRVLFYMHVLLFSIARLFYPQHLFQASKNISNESKTLEEFLERNRFLIYREF